MAKGNILKEAIADAKTVREVALQNAKAALEEAFTPKLQNMLSARLSEDLDEEYYDEDEKDMELGEMGDMHYDEDEGGEDDSMDEEIDLEEILNELELEEGKEADDEDVVTEGDDEEEDLEEAHRPVYKADEVQLVNPKAEYVHENDEFDLDALLKEINDLEEQVPPAQARPAVKRPKGKARKGLKKTGSAIPPPQRSRMNRMQETKFGCRDKVKELNETKSELKKIKTAFNTVNNELNEVNLLNSKLLYVNRIFKANHLDDAQKLRVVETLDKANSVQESKLIYETIKDSFKIAKNGGGNKTKAKTSIKESIKTKGMASKASGISRIKKTAPKKSIINESNNMINRFQKLANIKISE